MISEAIDNLLMLILNQLRIWVYSAYFCQWGALGC